MGLRGPGIQGKGGKHMKNLVFAAFALSASMVLAATPEIPTFSILSDPVEGQPVTLRVDFIASVNATAVCAFNDGAPMSPTASTPGVSATFVSPKFNHGEQTAQVTIRDGSDVAVYNYNFPIVVTSNGNVVAGPAVLGITTPAVTAGVAATFGVNYKLSGALTSVTVAVDATGGATAISGAGTSSATASITVAAPGSHYVTFTVTDSNGSDSFVANFTAVAASGTPPPTPVATTLPIVVIPQGPVMAGDPNGWKLKFPVGTNPAVMDVDYGEHLDPVWVGCDSHGTAPDGGMVAEFKHAFPILVSDGNAPHDYQVTFRADGAVVAKVQTHVYGMGLWGVFTVGEFISTYGQKPVQYGLNVEGSVLDNIPGVRSKFVHRSFKGMPNGMYSKMGLTFWLDKNYVLQATKARSSKSRAANPLDKIGAKSRAVKPPTSPADEF